MSLNPEIELLILRLGQLRRWLHSSKLGRIVQIVGLFVICYIVLGLGLIFFLFMFGVNPTLVLSVIAAPMWIGVLWLAYKVAKIIQGKDIRRER